MYSKADHHLSRSIDTHWGAASLSHRVSVRVHVCVCKKEKARATEEVTEIKKTHQVYDWTIITTHVFILQNLLSPYFLSPEKSTQAGQRTAGNSKACARQQRPPVFLEFGSQTMCVPTVHNSLKQHTLT